MHVYIFFMSFSFHSFTYLFISLQKIMAYFFHFKNTIEVSLHRLVICHQNTAQIQNTVG